LTTPGEPFSEDDEKLASFMAAQLAAANENVEMYNLQQENIELEEQNRQAQTASRIKGEFLANNVTLVTIAAARHHWV